MTGVNSMRKIASAGLSLLLAGGLLVSCTGNQKEVLPVDTPTPPPGASAPPILEQPSDVYYEIFVRAFADSDGDGIGDLNGLTSKLDYLNDGNPDTDTDLGIDGIWLMPILESPSYHGYDVTDYYKIDPDYGTMEDLKRLLDEAHKRGIKVIMDLVVNHTSTEHPWFKDSASGPDAKYRNWYTWASDREEGAKPLSGAVNGEAWHSNGKDDYLGIFWSGMPDLNFDNPKVREELIKIGQYWLEQGLDGFRIDAAKHIYGDFSTTVDSQEIQDKNKQWWQEFRRGLNEVKPDAYLVGEVWDTVAIVAPYFDNAFDSAFNFDLSNILISAAGNESNPDLAFQLKRIYAFYAAASNNKFIDATFLSNHDINRVMSQVGGNKDRARMAASLLLTLPGNPFIYYGEELGVEGMKPDERIREPMPWYADPAGGPGQTQWIEPMYVKGGEVSVEAQSNDESSMLSHYRNLIKWRTEIPALRNGGIDEFKPYNNEVAMYLRVTNEDRVLVAHNLTDEAQTVQVSGEAASESFGEVLRGTSDDITLTDGSLTLPPYSTAILK